MFHAFHSLGDDLQLESRSKTNHTMHDGQIAGVAQHPTDEALIDLQGLRGEMPQIVERGISSSEIINREPDSQLPARRDDAGNLLDAIQGRRFENLQFQPLRLDVRVADQQGFDLRHEVWLLQMVRGQIDADRQDKTRGGPDGHLL